MLTSALTGAVAAVAEDARQAARSAARSAALIGIAALFLAATILCLAASLWIVLSPLIGMAGATTAVAACFLAAAGACLVAAGRDPAPAQPAREAPPRPAPPPEPPGAIPQPAPSEAMLEAAAQLFRTHRGAGLATALLAGWISGLKQKR